VVSGLSLEANHVPAWPWALCAPVCRRRIGVCIP
jgi:hypothetical protein